MAKLHFTKDFDWPVPETRRFLAFRAGQTYREVKRACADDAIAAGVAKELAPPKRSDPRPRRNRVQ